MKTAQDILKTLFETPFSYKGKLVYVTDINGNRVEIGPYPYRGESAWHSPKNLKITNEPVTFFDPMKELCKEAFIKYHTAFLNDEDGEDKDEKRQGDIVAKGLKKLNEEEKEWFKKELAALVMRDRLADPEQFQDYEESDYFACEYERILKKIKA